MLECKYDVMYFLARSMANFGFSCRFCREGGLSWLVLEDCTCPNDFTVLDGSLGAFSHASPRECCYEHIHHGRYILHLIYWTVA